MQRFVTTAQGVEIWAEYLPATARVGDPILLVMGADASSVVWPEAFVELLRERHPVIRYDHRDTGRSTYSDEEVDYGVTDLAADAVAVLDAFGVEQAHVVGMSMGGTIAQLLLLDHPERVLTATLFCTGPLRGPTTPELPGPAPALLRLWAELDDPRDDEGELAWRVEHWRALNGTGTPFDAVEFRELEERVIAHAGFCEATAAHAHLHLDGLERGAELAAVRIPTLVIEAPDDPVYPPPNAGALARALGSARLVAIPGMGHAINRTVIPDLAAAVLTQTIRTR